MSRSERIEAAIESGNRATQHLLVLTSGMMDTLRCYAELHQGLRNMLIGGRLKHADIPDDYGWLVTTLDKADASLKATIAAIEKQPSVNIIPKPAEPS